jgi:hypothetical protein
MTVVRNFRQACLSRVVYPHRHTFRADMVGQLTQRCIKAYYCVVFVPVRNSVLKMDRLRKHPWGRLGQCESAGRAGSLL